MEGVERATPLSIADLACHPWAAAHAWHHIDLADYPNVRRWHDAIAARPAVARAYAVEQSFKRPAEMTEEMRRNLFGRPA